MDNLSTTSQTQHNISKIIDALCNFSVYDFSDGNYQDLEFEYNNNKSTDELSFVGAINLLSKNHWQYILYNNSDIYYYSFINKYLNHKYGKYSGTYTIYNIFGIDTMELNDDIVVDTDIDIRELCSMMNLISMVLGHKDLENKLFIPDYMTPTEKMNTFNQLDIEETRKLLYNYHISYGYPALIIAFPSISTQK